MKPGKNRWYLRALALVTASMLAAATFAAAADAGSQGDPLVTLSYLNDTFLPKILAEVQGKTGGAGGTADSFAVVTLNQGQALSLGLGGEVMLRVGSATCGADSAPGLIDSTTAGSVDNGGALVKNHLYLATIEGRTVKAAADGVKVLVRGTYSVT